MKSQEVKKRLGIELKEEPNLEELMAFDSRNTFACDEHGEVIGLNILGNKLTNEKVAFLWNIPELQALNLSENELSDVLIPGEMNELVFLNLSENKGLGKISFEGELPALKVLDFSECAITEIHFLNDLPALQTAYLQKNEINQVTFGGSCPKLKLLDLSNNKIKGFSLPAGFDGLERLYLNDNQITDLEFLGSLPALDTLHLRNNKLGDIPDTFLEPFPNLVSLYLYGNPLPDAIRGTVENNEYQNNLSFIKSYLRELAKGKELDNECKILLIGNGNVGKSCLVKRLVHNKFEPEWNSTHGIALERYKHQSYTFNIWDFGGQDIYHATHRLFMQSNAVYLILWDWDTENRPYTEAELNGEDRKYDNYILEYWLDYAIHLGEDSPVIIIQTKTGRDGKRDKPEIRNAYNERLSYLDLCHIESEEDDWDENGYNDLLTSIRRAVKRTKTKSFIPEVWAGVRRALREKQQAGEKKILLADFLKLAEELEDPMGVLENWLVKTGVVYFRKGLFQDEIILDQQWAIDAIYTIFDREKGFYFKALHQNGSFSGKDLEGIWDTKTKKEAERELFVNFMLSCEMCFETTQREEKETWRHKPFAERTFVAPQLRESKKPKVVETAWVGRSSLHLRYKHSFLHYGVIQSFIFRTQSLAEMQHIWRYGLLLLEGEQLAMVEAKEKEIRVQVTENGKELLDKIRNLLESLQNDKGEESVSVDGENYVLLKELEELPPSNDQIKNQEGKYIKVSPLSIFRNKDDKASFEEDSLKDTMMHPGVGLSRMAEFDQPTGSIAKKRLSIRQLISAGRLSEALIELNKFVPTHLKDNLVQIQARLSNLENKESKDTISFQEANQERNKIMDAALYLVNQVQSTAPLIGQDAGEPDRRITTIKEALENKTKILFVAANPTDASRLQTDKEHRVLKAELERGKGRHLYHFLPSQFAVTIGELLRAMNDEPNIVHFAGHGSTEGIFITTDDNKTQLMSDRVLRRLFHPLQGVVQIVVLNACYSAKQARIISEFGFYVVGNNLPISDPAAISFSKGFYNGLGEGKKFEKAFNDAMIVVETENPKAAEIIEVWKNGEILNL